MKPSKKPLIGFLLFLVISCCWWGHAIYTAEKEGRMASQCTILSHALANDAHKTESAGEKFDLDGYLRSFVGGPLFSRDGSGRLLDPWGTPLIVEEERKDGVLLFRVISSGKDGKRGTKDDFFREAYKRPGD